ncbi:alpha/beta hydrolase [Candidatus Mycobacterium methanotrophicum]|uniref:Alpha/beta hydrolase n=1 Tax=Candidatus Mycobacterium methanotrophicum TaxID=2943498 RepID=A0ABY4QL41_9MYCO|nr:alpha/beta hydrolase [Candidatus Mycobacterium methanotrophicum]UQX10695.1 alpha/beta hydrolase [Candidatus Mycobacterium methanotrophicum]
MNSERHQRHPLVVWAWSLLRLQFVGVACGALFFCLSLTPSLLPRDWVYQGLIGGINGAFGYGLGVVIGRASYRVLLRGARWWPPPPRALFWMKATVVAIAPTACVLMLIPAAAWQRQVSALMGIEGPTTLGYLRTLIVAVVVAAVLVSTLRVLIDAVKLLARMLIRRWHLHDEVALFIGTTIVVALLIMLINGVLVRGFFAGANALFQPRDTATAAGLSQPMLPEKSGSPASLAPWDSLGYQGRNFVATGPHAAQLARLNGRPAKEPIRVYAGLRTAPDDRGRLAAIVGELERTGAFSRKILVIAPTTGTGWIDPVAASSLEMLYNGDTAIVGLQYSYLPSWISFLADKQKSMDAGRKLIDTVHDRWRQFPRDHRPRLLLYGESLGSMAGQAAFGWLPDIRRMGFDAVLWVGPPQASPLWHALIARRDPHTTEVEPRYDNGRTVRFSEAIDPCDVSRLAEPPWQGTRVLFLQHPSDPVVWWSPDLLFDQPQWLIEPRGADRSAAMRWYPVVTFWQVSADLTNAQDVPGGHGHNYGNDILDGWVAVAPPDGWTPADTERVRASLNQSEL